MIVISRKYATFLCHHHRTYSVVSASAMTIRRLAFYDNTVEVYAKHQPHHLRVQDVLHLASTVDEAAVLQSAQYAHVQLPIRLARMIRTLQNLPFLVGINPYINDVYYIYWDAFQAIRQFRQIETLQDEVEFSDLLDYLLEKNKGQIDILSKGLKEVRQKMGGRLDSKFFNSLLDHFLREGMIRRLLISNHFALREAFERNPPSSRRRASSNRSTSGASKRVSLFSEVKDISELVERVGDDLVSVIDYECFPLKVIQQAIEMVKLRCTSEFGYTPTFVITGDLAATFPCVVVHLQYIVVEILKNAAHAVLARYCSSSIGSGSGGSGTPKPEVGPPIEVNIRKVIKGAAFLQIPRIANSIPMGGLDINRMSKARAITTTAVGMRTRTQQMKWNRLPHGCHFSIRRSRLQVKCMCQVALILQEMALAYLRLECIFDTWVETLR